MVRRIPSSGKRKANNKMISWQDKTSCIKSISNFHTFRNTNLPGRADDDGQESGIVSEIPETELGNFLHDGVTKLFCRTYRTVPQKRFQTLFTEFLAIRTGGLGDAIGEHDQPVPV